MTVQSFWQRLRRWLSPEPGSSLPRLTGPAAEVARPPAPPRMPPPPAEPPRPASGPMLRKRVYDAFNSSMPVATRHGLAGRQAELERLAEAVLYRSSHAIVFGPRGSGKTSLARIFGDVADEMRTLVIYNLASGDVGFADLFRPYLSDLAEEIGQPAIAAFAKGEFDARSLAGLLVETVRRPTVLVLDEFDRIVSAATKHEIAALMKLLSDMRASLHLLLVGIAGNIDDLLEGHPSLRRHLVAVPIGGIDPASMRELIQQLVARAGMTIDAAALDLLSSASRGSPYHSRLFGLHAGLAALASDQTVIDVKSVEAGLRDAFVAWQELGGEIPADQADELIGHTQLGFAMALAASMTVTSLRVDRQQVIADLSQQLFAGDAAKATDLADRMFARMGSDLQPAGPDQYLFADALKPQFLIELYRGTIRMPTAAGATGQPFGAHHASDLLSGVTSA